MEKAKHSVEFESEVDKDGKVQFSRAVGGELSLPRGSKVTVRIVGGVLSKGLTARNVSDEEIERIGRIQFEDREHVVRFLLTEGKLSNNRSMRKRLKGLTA
ncbi:MAG: hypothetical protein WBZ48_05115 [Bacteroidota bacterium]